MNKLIILTGIFLTVLTSCEKNNEKTLIAGNINIMYTDSIGQDLLDSNTTNFIRESDIDVYYLINGKSERVYNTEMALGIIYKIDTTNNKETRFLWLVCNTHFVNNTTITYIKIKEDMDTIKCQYRIFDNGYDIEKVWYNNVEQTTKYGMPFDFDFIVITK